MLKVRKANPLATALRPAKSAKTCHMSLSKICADSRDVVESCIFTFLDLKSHVLLARCSSTLLNASGLLPPPGSRAVDFRRPGAWKKEICFPKDIDNQSFAKFCRYANGLQKLNLTRFLTDVSAIENLTTLKAVSINIDRCCDISFLRYLPHLQTLKLDLEEHSKFTKLDLDVSFLKNNLELVHLKLSVCDTFVDCSFLVNLPKLKHLDLRSVIITNMGKTGYPGLEFLDLSSTRLHDITFLNNNFPVLRHLDLSSCNEITDVTFLAKLSTLKFLNLSETGVIDISVLGLSKMSSLEHLHLNLTEITSLPVLGKNLKSLDLSHCYFLEDIAAMSNLQKLKDLDLECCKNIVDFTILGEMLSLENLQLDATQITSLPVLGKNLKILNLYLCNRLEDLSAMSNLQKLKDLNLDSCEKIVDFTVLTKMSSLETLNLTATKIKSLPVLGKNLKSLDLSDCHCLKDVSGLSKLKTLVTLNLSCCYLLENLSGLAKLQTLVILDLSHCHRIFDLSALAKLQTLRSLDLSSCHRIFDLSALGETISLERLDVSYCHNLADVSALVNLPKLKHLNAVSTAVYDFRNFTERVNILQGWM
jgi:Leucine-rich repeat (LRR) protein